MRVRSALIVVVFAGVASMAARGSSLVIDNFSCSDTVTLDGPAGATAFNASFISCPGSIGGNREDFVANLTGDGASGGSAGSVSTITTNPPANAITGTFGSGIIGFEGMQWGVIGGQPNVFDLNLDLVGDSILLQLNSDSSGSASVFFGDTAGNLLRFSASFAASSSYQDVLIPLTNPTVIGSGSNLAAANQILLDIGLDTPGGTWSIDAASIETPEPSTLVVTGIALLGAITRSFWRDLGATLR